MAEQTVTSEIAAARHVAYAALTALWVAVAIATVKWCTAFIYQETLTQMGESGRHWYHSVLGGGSWLVGIASLVAAILVVRLAWMSKSDRRVVYAVCLMVVGFSLFAVLLSHGAWMVPVKGITLFSPRMEKWGIAYLVLTVVVLVVRPSDIGSPFYGAVIAFTVFILALTWHRWARVRNASDA